MKASTLAKKVRETFVAVRGNRVGQRTNTAYFNQLVGELEARAKLVDDANEGDIIVALSPSAYAMVCGLVAPSDSADPKRGVNHAGVFGPIEEVQANFPATDFWAAVENNTEGDDLYYHADGGW